MKLKSLTLHRLPGFKHRGFKLQEEVIGRGLNVVIGPNGSGKTSICQAICKILWPQKVDQCTPASIHSEWEHDNETFTVSVEDDHCIPSLGGKTHLVKLPDERFASCFIMTIDYLFHADDPEFAQKISEEIAGGFDIEGAGRAIAPGSSGKKEIEEWKEARRDFSEYEGVQKKLLQDEKELLPDLEKRIKEGETAANRLEKLEKIIQAKELQNKILKQASYLQTFPEALSRVTENDWKLFQKLTKEKSELEEKKKNLEETIAKLKWKEMCLPDEEEFERESRRIDRMREFESQAFNTNETIKKQHEKVMGYCRLLGIDDPQDIEKIRAAEMENLEEKWEELCEIERKIYGMQTQIKLLESSQPILPEALKKGIELLFDLKSLSFLIRSKVSFLFATGITFGVVWSLYSFIPEGIKILSFLPLLLLFFFGYDFWKRKKREKELRKKYSILGLPTLSDWSLFSIENRLQDLIHQWGDALHGEMQTIRKKELLSMLRDDLTLQERLEDALKTAAKRMGITHLPTRVAFRFASYLKDLHKEWSHLKEGEIAYETVGNKLKEEWTSWSDFASKFDESGCRNIHELGAVFLRIKDRVEKIKQLEQKNEELMRNQRDVDELLAKTGCTHAPLHLEALALRLPLYKQALNQLEHLMQNQRELDVEVAPHFHEDIEQLKREWGEEKEKAAKLSMLSEEKGALKNRIEQMEGGNAGQKRQERQEEKFQKVQIAVREFIKKELTEFLISEVRKDFRRECEPKVLRNAADWFHRFTKYAFTLEAPITDKGNVIYEAIETATGERRTLNQLSRGTRIQLLMAVRLAFAFESEKEGLSLPLFLDEVLSNTDPERFDAIAEVVSEILARGRQVFYFTCNPEDGWRWKQKCEEICLIDLRQIQRDQSFISAKLPIANEIDFIKPPKDQDVDSYVLELRLPSLRIDEPIEMTSIHYIVDSSDDLYRLLWSGVRTYGQWKHMRPELLEKSFSVKSMQHMNDRSLLLEQFFSLKKQGRGKVISRSTLIQGGISKNYLEKLLEIAEENKGDSKKLLAVLEEKKDERIKGFRAKQLEELRDFLLKEEYLDEQPILTDDEIRSELLPMTNLEENRIFIEKLF